MLKLSRSSLFFMDRNVCLQEPDTGPYTRPDESYLQPVFRISRCVIVLSFHQLRSLLVSSGILTKIAIILNNPYIHIRLRFVLLLLCIFIVYARM
jgi:hypothetical protein